jgi:hydrogenase maturation protease
LEGRLTLANASVVPQQTASTTREWKDKLRHALTSASPDSRVAIVGVGHPFRGDDHVGSFIVRSLLTERRTENVRFFDAEESIETMISKVADFKPKHVVFVDACEMNAKPGDAAFVSVAETDYPFFTTHGIPLKLLAKQFLPNTQAWVLTVQPEQMEFGDRLSKSVYDAAVSISNFIAATLKELG